MSQNNGSLDNFMNILSLMPMLNVEINILGKTYFCALMEHMGIINLWLQKRFNDSWLIQNIRKTSEKHKV